MRVRGPCPHWMVEVEVSEENMFSWYARRLREYCESTEFFFLVIAPWWRIIYIMNVDYPRFL
jgi:hypothetical protein